MRRGSPPPNSGDPEFIIAVHNGALGDFLCCWPALLALARHCQAGAAGPKIYFLGPPGRLFWLSPLGFAACPQELQAATESLYAQETLPGLLAQGRIFWFCLDKPPALPGLAGNLAHITPLPVLSPPEPPQAHFSGAVKHGRVHVLTALKTRLESLGITWPGDWPEKWRQLFGQWQAPQAKEIALLPGSGHCCKQWPERHFIRLAGQLESRGWNPVFIVGETELDRGLTPPPPWLWENPSPPQKLAQRLLACRAIVSNDAGPAHLAALHGLPGLMLFGPTSPQNWGAPGLLCLSSRGGSIFQPASGEPGAALYELKLNLNYNFMFSQSQGASCSPCTATTRDIRCNAPVCLEQLRPEDIGKLLEDLLAGKINLQATP